MANNNTYLARQQIRKALEMEKQRRIATQLALDAGVLAADKVFEPDEETIAVFIDTFYEAIEWLADIAVNDAKDDKKMEYTKGKRDALLKKTLGKRFLPWEECYETKLD